MNTNLNVYLVIKAKGNVMICEILYFIVCLLVL